MKQHICFRAACGVSLGVTCLMSAAMAQVDASGAAETKVVRLRVQEREGEDSRQVINSYAANRLDRFHYELGSLKPTWVDPSVAGYGGEGYGEMGGGYGAGGYGGDYGGMMGMMGGMGMGGPGGEASDRTSAPVITIYVFIPLGATDRPDAQLMLVTEASQVLVEKNSGPEGGMGASSYGGEDAGGGGYGGEGYGGGMMQAESPVYISLRALLEKPRDAEGKTAEVKTRFRIDEQEYQIVRETIEQTLAKRDLVAAIKRLVKTGSVGTSTAKMDQLESRLRDVLVAEYQTQLTRQQREVAAIEQRVSQLRSELSRRQSAMQRVVDVQLGNIVLEAQGLLQRP